MYNPILFKDRAQAGKKLAQELKKIKIKNPIVLAIPSGGIPVGLEIAKALKCPFSLVLVRKIQFPWTTEAGFGAVAPDGTSYLGPDANEGSTMFAAIKSIKKEKPKKVIVATPTSSGNAIQLIKPEVDNLIALYTHPKHLPFAVASSYEKWHDLTDKEAIKYLNAYRNL